MGVIASQITSPTIVYSIVYSDSDQRKHQSSASLAFVRGNPRGPGNSPHKWPITGKMFPFDDVIMSWIRVLPCYFGHAILGMCIPSEWLSAGLFNLWNDYVAFFFWCFSTRISAPTVLTNTWLLIHDFTLSINVLDIITSPALVQIMAWRRPPMVVSLPTHICVARPQWVKIYCLWAFLPLKQCWVSAQRCICN